MSRDDPSKTQRSGSITLVPDRPGWDEEARLAPTDAGPFAEQPPLWAEADDRFYLLARIAGHTTVVDLDDGAEITVGRAAEATLVVDDARVSRNHARILRRGAVVTLEDLSSRNGTQVDDCVLRAAERRLAGGEVIRIGPLELVVALASRGDRAATPLDPSQSTATDDVEQPEGVVVADPAMVEVYRVARRLAGAQTTVLLLGESGAGKEVIAEHIHRQSERASGPFVRLNCAALADSLLESELFGHERGAFTGADRRKAGYLEAAHGGTLLLDEVGELSAGVQAKLLRVLETRRVARIGSTQEVEVDVRFVCATHRELKEEVAAGRFRHDLYFRIGAATIRIPPLRQRPAEIALLADLFARQVARRAGDEKRPVIDDEVHEALRRYAWPGNVRELKNAIEYAVIMSEGDRVEASHLPEELRAGDRPVVPRGTMGMRDELSEIEKDKILDALEREGGNQTRAARRLGISRRNLVYKLAKYRIGR